MVMKTQTKAPNVMKQWLLLKKAFPYCEGGVRRNRLDWRAELQPSNLSDSYNVRLLYSLEMSPKTFVLNPELQERDGIGPPHRYRDGSLCLYMPEANEWNKHMYLSETIIPWVSEWLLHYEIWLGTGEWCGGGFHPGDGTEK